MAYASMARQAISFALYQWLRCTTVCRILNRMSTGEDRQSTAFLDNACSDLEPTAELRLPIYGMEKAGYQEHLSLALERCQQRAHEEVEENSAKGTGRSDHANPRAEQVDNSANSRVHNGYASRNRNVAAK